MTSTTAWRSLKHFCSEPSQYGLNISSSKYTDDKLTGWRLLRTTDIHEDGSLVSGNEVYLNPAIVSSGYRLSDGDLLLSRSGTLGRSYLCTTSAPPSTFAGYLIRFRPRSDVDPRYLVYCTRTSFFSDAIAANAVSSTISNFNAERYGNLQLPWHPVAEQRAIADYLDTETARIDGLISNKRRLIELLEERWSSEVRQVMSSSSSTRVALRHLCTIKRGQSPRPIDDPRYFDDNGSHGWVRIEDVTRGGMYLTETRQRLSEIGRARSVSVGPGMVLISIAATVGKPTITAMKCCYHDGFVGLHQLRAIPEYVYFFLTLPEVFGGLGQVGTQANINSEIVGHIKIPLPDRDEQQRVVNHLTASLHRIETAKSRLSTQLDLLTERRQALIAAVVTGEMPIPGVAT